MILQLKIKNIDQMFSQSHYIATKIVLLGNFMSRQIKAGLLTSSLQFSVWK